nr:MAG TPA: hypothetical protein [Caudoviricetes sp.]
MFFLSFKILNLYVFIFLFSFTPSRENRVLMGDLNMSLYSRTSRVHF